MIPRGGMTLIEVLLVVVILGLVAAAMAGGLARSANADAQARALADLRQADAELRLEARQHGALVVELQPTRVVATRPGDESRVWWQAPDELRVAWRDSDDSAVDRILIDAHGRGPDLRIELRDRSSLRRFHILGLSGQWLAQP